MSTVYMVAASAFLVVGLVTYLVLLVLSSRKDIVHERLEGLRAAHAAGQAEVVVDSSKKGEPGWSRTVGAVSANLPLSPRTKSHYGRMLVQAGFRSPGAVGFFFGSKVILSAGLFAALGLWSFSTGADTRVALAVGILGFIVGLLLPNIILNEKLKRRKTDIFHSLPDVLDLMTVCVEAGLGMDAAIIKISEEKLFSKNVLAEEFRLVSQEIRAGKPRVDALRDLGERTGVEDIKSLVALLIQTDKLGASLARSLRVHSDSLRTKRRQLAEEAAAKTTIKLIFPLAFFIFPAILVVLLGPAVIRIFGVLVGHVVK